MSHPLDRVDAAMARLRAQVGDRDVTKTAGGLDDPDLLRGLADITEARKALNLLEAAYSAEVERRSDRSLGYSGLAQREGHRTATSLIQHVTGQTRADVSKATSAGRDLVAALPPLAESDAEAPPPPWFEPLAGALSSGELSREQYDAIRRGLSEPPTADYPDLTPGLLTAAWREAAVCLIAEASDRPVEDLRAAARLARDSLDPKGVQKRFDERFAARSFRWWVDEHGQHHARIVFDDDAAAWMRTIFAAALRPRRGPRFVDADVQKKVDAEVEADPRTNEQLQYDTLFAILRTGAAADPKKAFGDRQPGVRIVTTRDDVTRDQSGGLLGVGHFEETGQTIPGPVLETYLCDAGTKSVTVDPDGNPLDVGREKRLYTKRQRDAIAIRDGGCIDCGAEASRCEVHHINHWWEHHGRTDVADGVLLCRNCHMRLHNRKWRIKRIGNRYWLHRPERDGVPPRLLRSRSLLRYGKTAS